MRQYQFDLPTTLRFRELIDEYGRMRRLEDMTPPRRGQRFNQFVADLLGCWGTDRVQANVLGTGEIDVAFTIHGTRFLLEAKWEARPVSFDPTAKLSRRISQRLSGTRGVFLSISGYTADARRVLRGQQARGAVSLHARRDRPGRHDRPGVSTDPARGPETTGTNREQRAYRRAANAAQTRPTRRPHGHPALQQMAADQRKRGLDGYFSSWRAITMRWIWLVPS